ncbi:MAG: helix-turn-helix domain-containing protein [Bradyrhizobium sp.]|nr:helix-turn-helix domain-containing protein [Bradyrhizobium sp.]
MSSSAYLKVWKYAALGSALLPIAAKAGDIPTTPPVNFTNSSTATVGSTMVNVVDAYTNLMLNDPKLTNGTGVMEQNLATVIRMTNARTAAQTLESMSSVVLDDAMRGCVERLLQCLHDPLEARIMGPARVRELLFSALRGPQADVLRALVEQQGQFSRIATSLNHLHAHYAEPLNIETLAGYAHMSASTFHEHFKRCTLLSPVQYLKRLRLLKAQQLLLAQGMGVAQAAHNVGYPSTSQFSREYKRYFLRNPGEERAA